MELSKNIITVLNDVCGKFGIAIYWSKENVMLYLKELMDKLINYEIYTSWMWLIIGILMLLICIFFIAKELKKDYKDENTIALFATLSIIPILIIGVQIYDFITIHTFLEKYIFEYIQDIFSNNE